MASCTWKSSLSGAPYATLTVAQNSRDTENNCSTISYSLVLYRPYNISSSASKSYSIIINGEKAKSGTTTIGGSGNKTIASGTVKVNHDADGAKALNFSFALELGITWDGNWIGTASASGNTNLTAIPRATQPTLSSSLVILGSTVTISCPRVSNDFTHTLRYTFGSDTGTIATSVATSQAWTIPVDLASQIPNTTSGKCTVTCVTYKGTTVIGTKTTSLTLYVPSSAVPAIDAVSITEATEGLAEKFGVFVQNKSTLAVDISASGVCGSSVVSIKTIIDSTTYTGSSFTTPVLTSSGTIDVTTTVTDSRGRSMAKTTTITVVAYSPPVINSMKALRINTSGTVSDEGTRLAVVMNFTIASVNNKNTRMFVIKYRKSSDTEFTTITSGTASTVYNDTQKFVSAPEISTDYAYIVRLEISDYFQTIVQDVEVSTAFTIMDFRNTGKGIAFGKVSEKDALEIAMETDLRKIVNVYAANGNLVARIGTSESETEKGLCINLYKEGDLSGTVRISETGDVALPTQNYDLVLKSGFTLNGGATVSRQGDIVTIYARVNYNKALSSGSLVEVGTVSEEIAPPSTVSAVGLQNGKSNVCSAFLLHSGQLYLRAQANATADTDFEFTIVYNKAATWQT